MIRKVETAMAAGGHRPRPSWARPLGAVAVIFGLMSLYSGGAVLFGSEEQRTAAGAVVPAVLWFNFLTAPAYVAAGIGILTWRRWGAQLALIVLLSLLGASAYLLQSVLAGTAYEMRTVLAMALRVALWAIIAALACRTLGCLKPRTV